MVDRLTNLIAIFENPALDFSKNRAEGDDILGDAYEYLMRHFATESGKSKGQFYTPAEVSRVIAQIIGIREAKTSADTTVYDPTCGSGSLLLKVADEAADAGHALRSGKGRGHQRSGAHEHDPAQQPHRADHAGQHADRSQVQGWRRAQDLRLRGRQSALLATSAGAPGSTRSTIPTSASSPSACRPPSRATTPTCCTSSARSRAPAKAPASCRTACSSAAMPRREIRRDLVRKGYIKGIIGLPANLFYGTGIPACIVVIDKEDAHARKGIFMIDASRGFMKDGPKNRLRAQDIHKIVDVFNRQLEIAEIFAHGVASTRSRRTSSTSTCRATSTARSPKTFRTSTATCGRHPRRGRRRAGALLGRLPAAQGRLCSSPTAPATSTWRWTRPRSSQPSTSIPNSPPSSRA